MTDSKFRSRKFQIACFCIGISAISLFSGYLTGAEWLTAVGLVLGLYGGANVAEAIKK